MSGEESEYRLKSLLGTGSWGCRLEMEDADRPKTTTLVDSSKLVPTKPTATTLSHISGERSANASAKQGRASAKDLAKQDLDAVKAFVWTVGLKVEVLALEEVRPAP
jgi:hypothetical protein